MIYALGKENRGLGVERLFTDVRPADTDTPLSPPDPAHLKHVHSPYELQAQHESHATLRLYVKF